MSLYLDIVGVLIPKDRLKLLYEKFEKQVKMQNLSKEKEDKLKEKMLEEFIKTKPGQKFFSQWLKENIPNFKMLKKEIENFKKKYGEEVLINSNFSTPISQFIAKEIGATGVVKRKKFKKGLGYYIDDYYNEVKKDVKGIKGKEYKLATPSYGKKRQKTLDEYNIEIKPRNLVELISMIKKEDLKIKKIKERRLKQISLEKFGLRFRKR